jgi:hypothetical protein
MATINRFEDLDRGMVHAFYFFIFNSYAPGPGFSSPSSFNLR